MFRKFDAGLLDRPKGVTNDCQVRALATATNLSWEMAWIMLYTRQGIAKACHFNLLDCLKHHARNPERRGDPKDLGFFGFEVKQELSFPAKKGKPRMTVSEFCKKHRNGRFILQVANHVVAVKHSIFYDTADCSHNCVYKAWEVTAARGEE